MWLTIICHGNIKKLFTPKGESFLLSMTRFQNQVILQLLSFDNEIHTFQFLFTNKIVNALCNWEKIRRNHNMAWPDPPPTPFAPNHSIQNISFHSLSGHTLFVLLFFSFSLNTMHALILSLTVVPPVHSTPPYTAFFWQGSLKTS